MCAAIATHGETSRLFCLHRWQSITSHTQVLKSRNRRRINVGTTGLCSTISVSIFGNYSRSNVKGEHIENQSRNLLREFRSKVASFSQTFPQISANASADSRKCSTEFSQTFRKYLANVSQMVRKCLANSLQGQDKFSPYFRTQFRRFSQRIWQLTYTDFPRFIFRPLGSNTTSMNSAFLKALNASGIGPDRQLRRTQWM